MSEEESGVVAVKSVRITAVEKSEVISAEIDIIGVAACRHRLRHDLAAAFRAVRYLAQKAKAQYDDRNAIDKEKIDSIDRHLTTLGSLQRDLLEPLLQGDAP